MMILIYGESKYGKVDRVPGLFHVVTSFAHLYYLPLIPIGTFVRVEGAGDVGRRIRTSGKSVLMGYLRSYSFLGALIASGLPVFEYLKAAKRGMNWDFPWDTLAIAVVCWILFALTYLLIRPSLARTLELAKELDIPLDALAQHFANDPRAHRMFAELQEPHFAPPEPVASSHR